MLKETRQRMRRFAAHCGRRVASPLVFSLFRRPTGTVHDPSVHMLVSSRTWDAGLLAAMGFELHTGRRWRFVIHDDGTVPEEAVRRMRRILPDFRFVPRGEADARMREFLRDHPRCLAQRLRHNLFLKFSDFVAFAPGERFLVLDSDVIFFRRPQEILSWVDGEAETCHYNKDTKEKYCIPRPDIEEALGIPLWEKFNSGLVLLPKAAMDMDLAERLLAAFETTAHHPQFFEQTLYGLMASAWGKGGALPPEYEISWGYFHRRGAVCRHYVGDFKHDLLYIEGAPLLLASVARQRLTVSGRRN